jgi:outer membrane protein assembly factor BamB
MLRLLTVGLLIVISSAEVTRGEENWPQWRGPLGTGVAADGEYPVKFSADEGLGWKVKSPGTGTSTPVVWGDRIFVTCGVNGQDTLLCYDILGNELWQRDLGRERKAKNALATGSNPSPVTDGERVVVYYKSGTVGCFDFAGNPKWKVNLQEQYGRDTLQWDLGTSPVLASDKVIIAVMQDGESYLVALDQATGEEVWKQARMYDCAWESDQSYSTPRVVEIGGRAVIVTWGADHLTGHDAATGELIWEIGGFNPDNRRAWRTIASAAVGDGMAVVPYGRGDYLAGVRIGGKGDVTGSNRVWDDNGRRISADVATPVIRGGRVYLVTEAGQTVCRDVKSGDELWSFSLPRHRDPFWASPVLAGDLLYLARRDGTVFVGRVTDNGFELLAENEMGETIIATPVPIRGGLLIRGEEHLFWVKPAAGSQAGG